MAVIAENLDHQTLAHMAVAAFLDHALEFLAQRPEFAEPDFDLFEMSARKGVGGGTAGARVI